MNSKEYKFTDGRTAVFEYDENGIGKITLECMDVLMGMIPQWIPCSERLPEKGNTTYLTTVDYGEFGGGVGQRFFYGKNIGWEDDAVVAWMPLPSPYTEEEQ